MVMPPAGLSITDLPTSTCISTAYDLSSLFDPTLQPSSWSSMQQMQPGRSQFSGGTTTASPVNLAPSQGGGGSGDDSLEELGRFIAVPCSSGNMPLSPHGSLEEMR
ncbi:hypothetical protein Ccrd_000700 [Cynara cardunculus var. scolymus]|uniref:Uncharacterized protein n=1 Tax=Cynara cardunculus var. scolymus TaxID=59895 RepID=A0A118JXI7_CYNCS|nr:hypothetical protein Ccrd_000700 [Cynara cardunculus var. scolymus]